MEGWVFFFFFNVFEVFYLFIYIFFLKIYIHIVFFSFSFVFLWMFFWLSQAQRAPEREVWLYPPIIELTCAWLNSHTSLIWDIWGPGLSF